MFCRRARRWSAVAALGASLFAAPALAQPDGDADDGAITDAKTLLTRANERFRDGDYRGAADGFQRLLEVLGEDNGWFLHYNLGLAFENAGAPTDAVSHYETFVTEAQSRVDEDASLRDRLTDAETRLAAMKQRYGRLEVQAGSEVVLVRVGSGEPRPAGFVMYLAPGEHALEIDHGTDRARRVSVTLVGGEATVVEALRTTTEAPPPAPPTPEVTEGDDGAYPTTAVIVLGALTAASIALPIGLNAYVNGLRDDALAMGTDAPGYPAARDDFQAARTGYYASFALPAALGVATAVVALVSIGTDEAAVGTNGQGLWITGRF